MRNGDADQPPAAGAAFPPKVISDEFFKISWRRF
jgi:hypothetical protein